LKKELTVSNMKNFLTAAALLLALNAWSQQLPTNEESSSVNHPRQKLQLMRSNTYGPSRAGSEPLYVVDGVPALKADSAGGTAHQVKVVPDLYANDVESIMVLTDAPATAQYGENGLNGVILITTKQRSPSKKQG
jgi:TonB-dependent SusC/RagA subfamily outer membrane receptor